MDFFEFFWRATLIPWLEVSYFISLALILEELGAPMFFGSFGLNFTHVILLYISYLVVFNLKFGRRFCCIKGFAWVTILDQKVLSQHFLFCFVFPFFVDA